jgi:hypothetical protein
MSGESEAPGEGIQPPDIAARDSLKFEDVATAKGEATVDVAYRWAQLYKNDVEFERFFDWIGRRSNPERTDFKQILDSLPLTFGPEDLPPPLRRYFLGRFG